MARPRRKPSAYERRQARARALGYASYYDYRAHDHGRIPADRPRVSGALLARLRGHRSAADLEREAKPGSLVVVSDFDRDDSTGRFRWVEFTVHHEDGSDRIFRLRGDRLGRRRLRSLVDQMRQQGAIVDPHGYLDSRPIPPSPPGHTY